MNAATTPVTGESVWLGRDLAERTDWIEAFDGREIDTLMSALHAARKRGLRPEQVRRTDFALPSMRERFAEISRQVESGRGFALIRGLPLDGLTDEDCRLLFWGIDMQVGMPVCQGKKLGFIEEVKDLGEKMGTATTRAYRAPGPLRFHNDQCDVLGLMCLRGAKSGGHSKVASAPAIHNAILERRPDYLEMLRKPYFFSQQGEEGPGEKPWYARPVFDPNGGRFTGLFSRSYIESAQKLEGVPKLSGTQDAASNYVAELATENAFTMQLQRGDIQLFNSHVTYHSRTDFEDHDEPEKKRTLARLWLATPCSRPLPEYVKSYWGKQDAGALRGGILQEGGKRFAFNDWASGGWGERDLADFKAAATAA